MFMGFLYNSYEEGVIMVLVAGKNIFCSDIVPKNVGSLSSAKNL